jgi:hypothetical protein
MDEYEDPCACWCELCGCHGLCGDEEVWFDDGEDDHPRYTEEDRW